MADQGPKARLVTFFVATYVISVPIWVAGRFAPESGLPLGLPLSDLVAVAVPPTVACVMARREGVRVSALLRRTLDPLPLSAARGAVAVALPLCVVAAAWPLSGTLPPSSWSTAPLLAFGTLGLFVAGAVCEELAYTAYLTEECSRVWPPWLLSILIGGPWAVWHVPAMLEQGRSWGWICWGVAGTVAFRYLYIRLYAWSIGTTASVVVAHAVYNMARAYVEQLPGTNPLVDAPHVHYGSTVALALIVGVFANRRRPGAGAQDRSRRTS